MVKMVNFILCIFYHNEIIIVEKKKIALTTRSWF